MTGEEHFNKMLELFPNMPNPEHQPRIFKHYLMLYKYHYMYKYLSEEKDQDSLPEGNDTGS
jgi:hypothetical protein